MKKQIIRRHSLRTDTVNLPDTLHPVLKRVLAARLIKTPNVLDYAAKNLLPYNELLGINQAVALLAQALNRQARILIVADYDADGATSCAVAVKALQQMGARHVGYLVPNREKHGYGLTPEIIELAMTDSLLAHPQFGLTPDLLITVDNGIASIEGVQVAKQYGIQVLVTDHHLPPAKLPPADAIVNPCQAGDAFPSKNLAGVGVIFYVMIALRAHLRAQGWFIAQGISEPKLADLLDLVALGTVADVVPLDYNNRILVAQGLQRMRNNTCCSGIRALAQVAKCSLHTLSTRDLGFSLGPRLNAAGRMDDMSFGIACLLSDNDAEALEYAQLLDNFNQERRSVEQEMHYEAVEKLDQLGTAVELPIGVCLFDENWHQGVIGILASRIKEHLHRPVIVFTKAENCLLRGSARSIEGVHIRDVLASINSQYGGMILKFGGHAMAAGLSILEKNFPQFQQIFDQEIRKHLASEDLQDIILSDGELSSKDFTLELAEQLNTITPWGQGFPEPIFDGKFELLDYKILKDKHLRLQVRPLTGEPALEVMAFNKVDARWSGEITHVHLAYRLHVNVYRGLKNVRLTAEYVAPEFSHA